MTRLTSAGDAVAADWIELTVPTGICGSSASPRSVHLRPGHETRFTPKSS